MPDETPHVRLQGTEVVGFAAVPVQPHALCHPDGRANEYGVRSRNFVSTQRNLALFSENLIRPGAWCMVVLPCTSQKPA